MQLSAGPRRVEKCELDRWRVPDGAANGYYGGCAQVESRGADNALGGLRAPRSNRFSRRSGADRAVSDDACQWRHCARM